MSRDASQRMSERVLQRRAPQMRLDFNIAVRGITPLALHLCLAQVWFAIFTASSSRSAPLIRPEFPAIFAADVRDPRLRLVASSYRHASAVGSLHLFALFRLATSRCGL
jgi:hypothetical protein